jgi:hypothetical protein
VAAEDANIVVVNDNKGDVLLANESARWKLRGKERLNAGTKQPCHDFQDRNTCRNPGLR